MFGRAFFAFAILLFALAGPGTSARAAEAVSYKFVLEVKQGTAVNDGTVPVVGTHFSISGIIWFRRYDLSGEINGNYVKVTGDWDGNYLKAEGEIVNGTCQLDFHTTGTILSAFISLVVH
jgi:hypothetical protein